MAARKRPSSHRPPLYLLLLLLYLPHALPLHVAPPAAPSDPPALRAAAGREASHGTTGIPQASSVPSRLPPVPPPAAALHLRPPPRRRSHRSNGGPPPPPPDTPLWGAHPPPEPPLHPLPHLQLPPLPPQASLSPPSPVVASSSSPSVARSPMNKPRPPPKAPPPPPAPAAPNVSSAPSLVSEGGEGGEGEFVGWGGGGGREMSYGRPPPGPELRLVGSRSRRQDVYIAGFFPFGPRGPGGGSLGRGVMPAVKLAVDHINDSPDVLRGYRLHVYWNDTQRGGVNRDLRMSQHSPATSSYPKETPLMRSMPVTYTTGRKKRIQQ
ncbi:uncharacterized protein [Hetaerina americana]|uniref:uncharacterized protein n=1 Tax=Hetaerina americana TaxID=62018 RepID=UPI003A7F2695